MGARLEAQIHSHLHNQVLLDPHVSHFSLLYITADKHDGVEAAPIGRQPGQV
jgi:hypothetical protein